MTLFAFWFLLETFGNTKTVQVVGPFDTKAQCLKVADLYEPHDSGVTFGSSISWPRQIGGVTCWFTEPPRKRKP